MKSFLIRFKLLISLLILAFSVTATSEAVVDDSEPLPEIFSPLPELQEGLEVELSHRQIELILPWASNSASLLEDLLENTESLPKPNRLASLVSGVKENVIQSSPKENETLMRFVLNRGLRIVEIVETYSSPRDPGVLDAKLRLIVQSIKMAISYYKDDLSVLALDGDFQGQSYAEFAVTYSMFLSDLSNSIMSARAQFELERLNLGFLQWDLYRDSRRNQFGTSIKRIYNHLNTLRPPTEMSDQLAIYYTRSLKKVKNRALADIEVKTYELNPNPEAQRYEKDAVVRVRVVEKMVQEILDGLSPYNFTASCGTDDDLNFDFNEGKGGAVSGQWSKMKEDCLQLAYLEHRLSQNGYSYKLYNISVTRNPEVTYVSGECYIDDDPDLDFDQHRVGLVRGVNLEQLDALCEAIAVMHYGEHSSSGVTSINLNDTANNSL